MHLRRELPDLGTAASDSPGTAFQAGGGLYYLGWRSFERIMCLLRVTTLSFTKTGWHVSARCVLGNSLVNMLADYSALKSRV